MTSPGDLTVVEVRSPEHRARAFDVRRAVFVQEQGVPEELEMDAIDDRARHWLAIAGTRPVGTARAYSDHPGEWHIGRVAVLAEWRGKGIGRQLMEAIHDAAREADITRLVLNAQVSVRPFYAGLGYAPYGDTFYEAGILHQAMEVRL